MAVLTRSQDRWLAGGIVAAAAGWWLATRKRSSDLDRAAAALRPDPTDPAVRAAYELRDRFRQMEGAQAGAPATATMQAGSWVLVPGIVWAYLWDRDNPSFPTVAEVIAQARALGVGGIIVHAGLRKGMEWAKLHGEHLEAAGLHVAVGLALDGIGNSHDPAVWLRHRVAVRDAILRALRETPYPIVLDWEGIWEERRAGGFDAHRDDAAWIVAEVLRAEPDARWRIVDVPWWKPEVHSDAPTVEFGRLVSARLVQAYGAARTREGETVAGTEGRTGRFLAHSRTAYPPLAQRAGINWPIGATVQGYGRSTADHLAVLRQEIRAERPLVFWHLFAVDRDARQAFELFRAERGLRT